MGVSGPDLQLSEAALTLFPYDVECRNKKACNVLTEFWEMSKKNTRPTIGVFKRTSRSKSQSTPPIFVMDEATFVALINKGRPNEQASAGNEPMSVVSPDAGD